MIVLNNSLFFKNIFVWVVTVNCFFPFYSYAKDSHYLLPLIKVVHHTNSVKQHFSEKHIQKYNSLDALLDQVVGLNVRKQSGLGSFSNISFEGGALNKS